MADRRYRLIGCLLLMTTVIAHAATPTEVYLTARDKAIASVAGDGPAFTQAGEEKENRLLAALEPMIRAVVGPIGLKGFSSRGKANVDTLAGNADFGKLDGLAATSTDGKARVIVSTVPLLEAWEKANFPEGLTPASQPGDFITQAVRNDAHAFVSAVIPVVVHDAGDTASAALFQFAQDDVGSHLPNKVAVTVVRQGRVFVFVQAASVAQIPACKAVFDSDSKVTAVAMKTLQNAKDQDEAVTLRILAMGQADSDRFGSCFAKEAASQPWFKKVASQAQALVNIVPVFPNPGAQGERSVR